MSSEASDDDTGSKPPRTLLVCGACDKQGPPKTCSDCKMEFYCNVECQKVHRKAHRPLCLQLKKLVSAEEEQIEKANQIVQDKQQSSATECVVCMDDNVRQMASFVKLDCGHFFCYGCVHKCQFQSAQTRAPTTGCCPLCRAALPTMSYLLTDRNYSLCLLAKDASTEERRDEICTLAIEELESVLQTYPGLTVAWEGLGKIYMIMKQYDQAITSYVKALNAQENAQENANNVISTEMLKKMLETTPEEVLDINNIYHGSLARKSTFWCCSTILLLTAAHTRTGDVQCARKLISVVDQLVKQHSWVADRVAYDLAVSKAECCYHLGEYEEALQITEDNDDPSVVEPSLNKVRAKCLKELGRVDEAALIVGQLYYCATPWNEATKRENLKLWNEINAAEEDEE